MLNKLIAFILVLITNIVYVNAESVNTVVLPWVKSNDTVQVSATDVSAQSWWIWKKLFLVANDYIWIFATIIAVIVVIWQWYELFASEWREDYLKKVNWTIIHALIWFVILVFSYFFVRLLLNFF